MVGKSFDRVLTNKGYEVVMAHNAAEALERMRKSEYDLPWTLARNAHELKHLREWAGGQNSCTPQWP